MKHRFYETSDKTANDVKFGVAGSLPFLDDTERTVLVSRDS
jgi:hypothetical protein